MKIKTRYRGILITSGQVNTMSVKTLKAEILCSIATHCKMSLIL